jgi:hypothetical protein
MKHFTLLTIISIIYPNNHTTTHNFAKTPIFQQSTRYLRKAKPLNRIQKHIAISFFNQNASHILSAPIPRTNSFAAPDPSTTTVLDEVW